jgi:uncharacterized delta-60 repeat protein
LGASEIFKIAIRPGGAILATGATDQYRRLTSDMFVAKLRSGGSMSRKFGRRGTRTIDTRRLDYAYDLALQADGKVVVAGTSLARYFRFHARFAVLRLTRRGRLDRTFSRNGKTLTRFDRRFGCGALALTLQPNGRIIAAGKVITNEDGEHSKFALARYKNDGRPRR